MILEWCSEGRHAHDSGVSILAFNPPGKITHFRTYYDPAAFVEKAATPSDRK